MLMKCHSMKHPSIKERKKERKKKAKKKEKKDRLAVSDPKPT